MFSKIVFNNNYRLKQKIKKLILYYNRRNGARKSWKNRHRKVYVANYGYQEKCDSEIEKIHKKVWGPFRGNVDLDTLRIGKNISGISDVNIVPEDIFTADIEPTLIEDIGVHYISNKSFYNRWFPKGIFPEDLCHKIGGQLKNSELDSIDLLEFERLADRIQYPVILKPNRESYGGENIHFVKNKQQLQRLEKSYKNFVVQKKIEQHQTLNKINPYGLNTVKVFLYKSVNDENWHVLSMALRMGVNGSLDNEAAGGINTLIREDGFLNGYAIDKLGNKYYQHPDTGIDFNFKIPDYEDLVSLSLRISNKIFLTRLVGLDACYDKYGNWRLIEINTFAQSIRFSQYGGKPFFGKFTNEVISYCKNNHWALRIR